MYSKVAAVDRSANDDPLQNAFWDAVCNANLKEAEDLLIEGADIEAADAKGRRSLHAAVRSATLDMVQFILDHGAEVSACDEEGSTPLHHAARFGIAPMVDELIKRGARMEAKTHNKETAVMWAVRRESPALLTHLIGLGARTDVKDADGRSLLTVAADSLADSQTLLFLIGHGCRATGPQQFGNWKTTMVKGSQVTMDKLTPKMALALGGFTPELMRRLHNEPKARSFVEHPLALVELAQRAGHAETVAMLQAQMARHVMSSLLSRSKTLNINTSAP